MLFFWQVTRDTIIACSTPVTRCMGCKTSWIMVQSGIIKIKSNTYGYCMLGTILIVIVAFAYVTSFEWSQQP